VGAVIMVLSPGSGHPLGAGHQTLFDPAHRHYHLPAERDRGRFREVEEAVWNEERRHMSLLEVRKVSRFFGGIAAVKDVSFDVRKDEILGLIGPNGAGKTTLFNVINGFYQPSRGDVFFKGGKISGFKPHQICRRGIARTFQVVKPLQRMNVHDNVVASAFLRAKDREQAEKIATETLEFAGLTMTGT
jgi:ABC-type branched-subunit amino acid transport system ATPase component